jgi:hypothetical protein
MVSIYYVFCEMKDLGIVVPQVPAARKTDFQDSLHGKVLKDTTFR